MYKIEKDIPIPRPRRKYPFEDMEVGDSVFVEGKRPQDFSSYFWRYKPMKSTCRSLNGGTRIWRIK
jgi:hypothetical protein